MTFADDVEGIIEDTERRRVLLPIGYRLRRSLSLAPKLQDDPMLILCRELVARWRKSGRTDDEIRRLIDFNRPVLVRFAADPQKELVLERP